MSNPTLDDIMGELASSGFDQFDVEKAGQKARANYQRMSEEAEAEAGPVAECFATPAGRMTLLWLMRMTIFRGPGDDEFEAKTAEEFAIAKAKREGQSSIVFTILKAMALAPQGHTTRIDHDTD